MNLVRLAFVTCLLAAASSGAQAQWWLPGGGRSDPPIPPATVPGVPAQPAPQPAPQPQPGAPMPLGGGAPGGQAQPAAPPQPRPASVRTAAEEEVIGRDLRRNGSAGRLRIERGARGPLAARLTLEGTQVSRPGQACEVKVADGEAIPLKAEGRPEGSLRFSLEAPACPMAFDVLEGAVLVPASAPACIFEANDCRAEVRGLWGPEPGALLALGRAIETSRGDADRQVRENYRVLAQRANPGQVRAVASEQAAFSSEREMTCRDYAREGAHGFCAARFTAARAASLAGRLGLIAPNAAPAPAQRRPANPNPPATSAAPQPPRAQPF